MVDGSWKLIHRLDDDGSELYDLSLDPRERDDRYVEESGSDSVARLTRSLLGFMDLPRLEPQPVGLGAEELERLRAPGYTPRAGALERS